MLCGSRNPLTVLTPSSITERRQSLQALVVCRIREDLGVERDRSGWCELEERLSGHRVIAAGHPARVVGLPDLEHRYG
jgi:hypothetical protein